VTGKGEAFGGHAIGLPVPLRRPWAEAARPATARRRIVIALLLLAALLALAVLAGGYLGPRHPAGDTAAAFRIHAAATLLGAAALLLILGPGWLALLVALPGLAALAEPAALRLVAPSAGSVAVYQKNLHFGTEDVASVVFDLEATRPDVVMLQEVSPSNEGLLPLLARSHPTQHRCAQEEVGNTAILSRWPALPGTAGCLDGASHIRVMAPGGPLWLVCVHLRWPWPWPQIDQAERLARALAALDGPMVVAGDWNAAPWSRAVRLVEDATGARALRPAPATHRVAGLVPVSIDHVLCTGRGTLERRPLARSDHNGLLARLDPFAGAAQASVSAASKG
jgi:endonuclease/exonuclease/phosphatase (EEP) superfamily protein YafD